MLSKSYLIERFPDGEIMATVLDHAKSESYQLPHVMHHSPTGFNFGYGGNGPADLALSIMCDHLGEKPSAADVRIGKARALRHYQDFKWAFIAPQQGPGFTIETNEIRDWLKARASVEVGAR